MPIRFMIGTPQNGRTTVPVQAVAIQQSNHSSLSVCIRVNPSLKHFERLSSTGWLKQTKRHILTSATEGQIQGNS
jgi:hypothetical protein